MMNLDFVINMTFTTSSLGETNFLNVTFAKCFSLVKGINRINQIATWAEIKQILKVDLLT